MIICHSEIKNEPGDGLYVRVLHAGHRDRQGPTGEPERDPPGQQRVGGPHQLHPPGESDDMTTLAVAKLPAACPLHHRDQQANAIGVCLLDYLFPASRLLINFGTSPTPIVGCICLASLPSLWWNFAEHHSSTNGLNHRNCNFVSMCVCWNFLSKVETLLWHLFKTRTIPERFQLHAVPCFYTSCCFLDAEAN
jgi:hypothetical protein